MRLARAVADGGLVDCGCEGCIRDGAHKHLSTSMQPSHESHPPAATHQPTICPPRRAPLGLGSGGPHAPLRFRARRHSAASPAPQLSWWRRGAPLLCNHTAPPHQRPRLMVGVSARPYYAITGPDCQPWLCQRVTARFGCLATARVCCHNHGPWLVSTSLSSRGACCANDSRRIPSSVVNAGYSPGPGRCPGSGLAVYSRPAAAWRMAAARRQAAVPAVRNRCIVRLGPLPKRCPRRADTTYLQVARSVRQKRLCARV